MKKILILIILFTLYIFVCAYSYAGVISDNLQENVFRLHVIANSNLETDQNLKYIVRDELIKYMNELCVNINTKQEVVEIAQSHIEDLKKIAQDVVISKGFDYSVNVEIGNFEFPTKKYGDIVFPAGDYDGIKVKLGEAKGQNWWCVMFPPLCFINPSNGIVPDDSKELLKNNLPDEEYNLISETYNSKEYNIKFKVVELFKNKNTLFAKK